MRRHVLSLFLLIAVGGPAASQGQAPNIKRQIAALEDHWIALVVKRDSAGFTRLLTRDFVYTENDRVSNRAQLIRDIVTGTDTVTSGENEDLNVRVWGNTAVATGWLVLHGRGAGGPFTTRYRYTDTWVKIGPRWYVASAQDYKTP